MAKKTVIAGSDNVTAKQLKEFMNQIDLCIITGSVIQSVLDDAKLFSVKHLHFGKHDIVRLIDLMWGSSKRDLMNPEEAYKLPVERLRKGKDILMYAMAQFRTFVGSWDQTAGNTAAHVAYYKDCFDKLDAAKDDEQLAIAINHLAISIQTD